MGSGAQKREISVAEHHLGLDWNPYNSISLAMQCCNNSDTMEIYERDISPKNETERLETSIFMEEIDDKMPISEHLMSFTGFVYGR